MERPRKESITDQVYEIIRSKILDQTYGFGCKININKLASELCVSNTPIREAIFMLEKEGLAVVTPYSCPKVTEMSESKFKEIADTVLILLVGGYYSCLIKNKIPMLIEMMEDHLRKQKEIVVSGSDQEYAKASIFFEECILLVLDNPRLDFVYNSLFDLLFLAVLYDHQNSEVDRNASIQEHELILRAIRESDNDKVVALLRKHYSGNLYFPN